MQNAEFRMQNYGIACADELKSVVYGHTKIQHYAFSILHSKSTGKSQCFLLRRRSVSRVLS